MNQHIRLRLVHPACSYPKIKNFSSNLLKRDPIIETCNIESSISTNKTRQALRPLQETMLSQSYTRRDTRLF